MMGADGDDAIVVARQRRRRRKGTAPYAKVTFQISEQVMHALKEAVARGVAPSANAFVEEAIVMKLRDARAGALDRAYAQALDDPAFIADLADTNAAFDAVAADGLSDADDDSAPA